jgi:hypothetical protein
MDTTDRKICLFVSVAHRRVSRMRNGWARHQHSLKSERVNLFGVTRHHISKARETKRQDDEQNYDRRNGDPVECCIQHPSAGLL